MLIQRTFSFRLQPNKVQLIKIAQAAGCARYIYNFALALLKKAVEAKEKLTYEDVANLLPELKKDPATAWLKDVPSQILQQALMILFKAFVEFLKNRKSKRKVGFPKFKKKGIKDSFRYPQGVKVVGKKVFLPKIGEIKLRGTQQVEGKIKQAVVKREGAHWFVYIACEIEMDIPQITVRNEYMEGIDVGLLSFATLSNGITIGNPHFLKNELEHLKFLQQALSKTKKGSRNRAKYVQKINRLHTLIKNKRKDFLHKVTTELVKNYDGLVIEDLHIAGMLRNRHLAQAIADVSWAKFIEYLRYKCSWYGKKLITIGRFLPTSKTCSRCGNKKDMPLHMCTYNCDHCGLVIDRDLNAAINIRMAGISVLQDQPEKSLWRDGVGFSVKQEACGF